MKVKLLKRIRKRFLLKYMPESKEWIIVDRNVYFCRLMPLHPNDTYAEIMTAVIRGYNYVTIRRFGKYIKGVFKSLRAIETEEWNDL